MLSTSYLHPVDGGSMDLRNVGILPQPRRLWAESSPSRKPQISHQVYVWFTMRMLLVPPIAVYLLQCFQVREVGTIRNMLRFVEFVNVTPNTKQDGHPHSSLRNYLCVTSQWFSYTSESECRNSTFKQGTTSSFQILICHTWLPSNISQGCTINEMRR